MSDVRAWSMEEIQAALADRKLKEVARQCGLKYHTVLEVANGNRTNPTYTTYMALVQYLSK